MSKAKDTPELQYHEGDDYVVVMTPDQGTDDAMARVDTVENARRITACWNACKGFDTDYLADIAAGRGLKAHFESTVKECERTLDQRDKLKEINAELLEALERIKRTKVVETFGGDGTRYEAWLEAFIDAAIAKAS